MKIKMDNSKADEFIKKYLDTGRPRLSRRIEKFNIAPINPEIAIPYARGTAKEAVKEHQSKFLPLLGKCKRLDEVIDILFEYFEKNPIPGISDQCIMDYAEYYSDLYELEREANCTCLLKDATKRRMQKNGLNLNNFQDTLKGENANFKQLTSRELVDFLNKYSKDILK